MNPALIGAPIILATITVIAAILVVRHFRREEARIAAALDNARHNERIHQMEVRRAKARAANARLNASRLVPVNPNPSMTPEQAAALFKHPGTLTPSHAGKRSKQNPTTSRSSYDPSTDSILPMVAAITWYDSSSSTSTYDSSPSSSSSDSGSSWSSDSGSGGGGDF